MYATANFSRLIIIYFLNAHVPHPEIMSSDNEGSDILKTCMDASRMYALRRSGAKMKKLSFIRVRENLAMVEGGGRTPVGVHASSTVCAYIFSVVYMRNEMHGERENCCFFALLVRKYAGGGECTNKS